MMKWLTLEQIKQQLRIEPDFTDEDAMLEMYGNAAEEAVLNIINRSYNEVVERCRCRCHGLSEAEWWHPEERP